jgi:hypothetical protein
MYCRKKKKKLKIKNIFEILLKVKNILKIKPISLIIQIFSTGTVRPQAIYK